MDIPISVDVECVDVERCGKSSYVVLDPANRQVTHFVVERHVFPRTERVVPVDMIRESTPNKIALRCTEAELDALPPFVELEYQQGTDEFEHYEPGQWLFAPAALPAQAAVPLERQNVPEGTLALRRGADVEATDGNVGKVGDLVVDPVSSEITHLVLHRGGGLLHRDRQVMLEASTIDHITDETIYLNIDSQAIDQLPDRPVGGEVAQ